MGDLLGYGQSPLAAWAFIGMVWLVIGLAYLIGCLLHRTR